MFHNQVDTITNGLEPILIQRLDSAIAGQYVRQWSAQADLLMQQHVEVKVFFREILVFTQQLNKSFELDSGSKKAVRELILFTFTRRKSSDEPNQNSALNTPSGFNGLDQLSINSGFGQRNEKQSPRHYVFLALLGAIGSRFDTRAGRVGMLRLDFVAKLSKVRISAQSKLTIERWAKSEHFTGNFDSIPEAEMREILDVIYEICCTEIGPVDADQLFSDAANSTDQISAASHYSVRKLL